MYDFHDPSLVQRWTLAGIGAIWLALAWWLLVGGGLFVVGGWFGKPPQPGDAIRRAVLAAALSIYYIRILFTEFVFLKRGVRWSEVFTIASWLLVIYVLLAFSGGLNPRGFGIVEAVGLILFISGSWANSYAEFQRDRWKLRPENRGRLYTQGLFHYTRHPNYLGDLVSFSGLSMISGAWLCGLIPAIMFLGFVFVNIPMLDGHLHGKYGAVFDEYASTTAKLIPYVY